jgi:hypothetical protein
VPLRRVRGHPCKVQLNLVPRTVIFRRYLSTSASSFFGDCRVQFHAQRHTNMGDPIIDVLTHSFPGPFGSSPTAWPPTTFATSTSSSSSTTYIREMASPTFSSTGSYPTQTGSVPIFNGGNKNFWEALAGGARVGVVCVVVFGLLCIVLFSAWFCCGCCHGRRCGRKRIRPATQENRGDLPLSTIGGAERRTRPDEGRVDADPPPPQYAEAVPPQHQTIEGGITHVREEREEEEGIISDGKTPLSEIPFEDIALGHPVSAGSGSGSGSPSSAREFALRHHAQEGDTRGHTNS